MTLSNRDPDAAYDDIVQALEFMVDQALKRVRTSMPGIVVGYNATTRRAQVQPAIDLLLASGRAIPRAVTIDVPVIFPSGGDFSIHFPLTAGDQVMLLFSHRSIESFKASGQSGPPPNDEIMDDGDVVAIAGWVPNGITPQSGLSLQTNDGGTHIAIEDGHVTIDAARITLRYNGGVVEYP